MLKSQPLQKRLGIKAGEAALWVCFLFFVWTSTSDAAPLKELSIVPQNAQSYLPPAPNAPLLSNEQQQEKTGQFLTFFYAPWRGNGLDHLKINQALLLYIQAKTVSKGGWDKNNRPLSKELLARIQKQMDVKFGTLDTNGISLAHADLRVLPTDTPFYPEPSSSAARYFDRLQNSTLKPGEPLRIHHQSQDGKWLFISNASAVGWVKKEQAAPVTAAFIESHESSPLSVIIADNIPLASGRTVIGKIGTLLVLKNGVPQIPAISTNGTVILSPAKIAASQYASFPLPLTPVNATRILSAIGPERYGWGGSYGLRDCSATTQDYATVFGIWLPRNSKDQAAMGRVTPVASLSSSQKQAQLLQLGVPFATLVHLPGHIMLYVGEHKGQPIVFHNLWGIHILKNNKPDRYVVGRTLFSTLSPGAEFPNRRPNSFLVNRMDSFNIIIP